MDLEYFRDFSSLKVNRCLYFILIFAHYEIMLMFCVHYFKEINMNFDFSFPNKYWTEKLSTHSNWRSSLLVNVPLYPVAVTVNSLSHALCVNLIPFNKLYFQQKDLCWSKIYHFTDIYFLAGEMPQKMISGR